MKKKWLYSPQEAVDECNRLSAELAEARAEVERLNAIADMQRVWLEKRDETIIERDKFIEQMREALLCALTNRHTCTCYDHDVYEQQSCTCGAAEAYERIKVALVAERGEG